jgi:integrase-like protein
MPSTDPKGLSQVSPTTRRTAERIVAANSPTATQKPKLLEQVRHAIRMRHYSPRTEETYVHWIKRYIFFHNKRHPAEIGEKEIARFLSSLAGEHDLHPRVKSRRQGSSQSGRRARN